MTTSFDKFRSGKRQPVRLSEDELIQTGNLGGERDFPLVIRPRAEGLNLVSWAASNRDFIEQALLKNGAILFRGFPLASVEAFEEVLRSLYGSALDYTERSSPRSQVSGKVYTSTDYPPEHPIFLHNEQSYNLVFPLRIAFFCLTAAETGGETPIADCRRVFQKIDPAIRRAFQEKGYLYARNFGHGLGLSWQEAFRTEDEGTVEQYCRDHEIDFEWKGQGRLCTRQRRSVGGRHPRSGDFSWFNHLTFFHVTTLAPDLRDSMRSNYAEEDLPNNTYYGDGTPIETDVLDELRAIYEAETVSFLWERGDLLLLDNMLVAHGRSSFTGARKVVVGMAEPFAWKDVEKGA
ncbi:MAG: TauD/TfdA family dioxygenase [Acidobacteriota bacterium]